MNPEIFPGEFYFKLTSNGNLVGEFTNRGTDHIGVESAARREAASERDAFGFTGTYRSSWVEPNDRTPGTGVLTITLVNNPSGQLLPRRYRLEWRAHAGENAGFLFHGHGFVADGLLIGHYGDGPESAVRSVNAGVS